MQSVNLLSTTDNVCVPNQAPESFRMPLPMVTIIASGKSVAGKLRCVKEFLIVPAPGMPLFDVCCSSLRSAIVLT